MSALGRGLDPYVRRIFLGALAACTLIFMSLWMVGDFFGKLDDILEAMQEDPEGNTLGTMAGLVGRYFLANMPFFLHYTAPFIPLIAALYTVSRLLRSNELMPMVTAGESLFRVLRPILTWTLVFAGLVFAQQELLLPGLTLDQKHLGRRIKGKSTRELTQLPIVSDRLGNRYIIHRYDPHPQRQTATPLIMVKTGILEDGSLARIRQVFAPSARYVRKTADGRKGWVLAEGSFEEIRNENGMLVQRPLRFLTGSRLKPRDIELAKLEKPAMNVAQLRKENRRHPDPALVLEIHRHFTHPLKCLMLLLLGLPFLMRAYMRQLGLGPVLKCLVTCAGFYLADFMSMDLGNRGDLGPGLAAWLPMVLFAALGAAILDRVRT